MRVSRRAFLKGASAMTGSRAIVALVPPASLFFAQPAKAEAVTIVIAIAAAVAGMIASHNRSDGGLGAYLNAINQKLDVAIGQLSDIEAAVGDVLVKLANFKEDITEVIGLHDVQQMHDAVVAATTTYTRLGAVRKRYASDHEFIVAGNNLSDLNSLMERLEQTTSTQVALRVFGPAIAMTLPSAMLLQHSIQLLREDPRADIAARLDATYRPWLDAAVDPTKPDSTAYYRAKAAAEHADFWQQALENPLGKQIAMTAPATSLLECIGINDFEARHSETAFCEDPGFSGVGYTPANNATTSPRLLKVASVPCSVPIPDRHGEHERMFQNFSLTEFDYTVDLQLPDRILTQSAGYFALRVVREERSPVLKEGDPMVPAQCSVRTLDDEDPAHRARWLTDRLGDSEKQKHFDDLSILVDEINARRARIAYATSSLTLLAEARHTLDDLLEGLAS
ncbi:MAG: hypothetical protein WBA73_10980 [Devosia sp.]